jgi:Na+-translocating ferredoxin:NAD+ oxidoreductase RnfE subunit
MPKSATLHFHECSIKMLELLRSRCISGVGRVCKYSMAEAICVAIRSLKSHGMLAPLLRSTSVKLPLLCVCVCVCARAHAFAVRCISHLVLDTCETLDEL